MTLRPGPEVQVMASPVLLWRVLTNVVDNAARAAGSNGRVEISVAMMDRAPPRARLEVLDNGPGFGHGPPGAASLGLGVVTSRCWNLAAAAWRSRPRRAAARWSGC